MLQLIRAWESSYLATFQRRSFPRCDLLHVQQCSATVTSSAEYIQVQKQFVIIERGFNARPFSVTRGVERVPRKCQ